MHWHDTCVYSVLYLNWVQCFPNLFLSHLFTHKLTFFVFRFAAIFSSIHVDSEAFYAVPLRRECVYFAMWNASTSFRLHHIAFNVHLLVAHWLCSGIFAIYYVRAQVCVCCMSSTKCVCSRFVYSLSTTYLI